VSALARPQARAFCYLCLGRVHASANSAVNAPRNTLAREDVADWIAAFRAGPRRSRISGMIRAGVVSRSMTRLSLEALIELTRLCRSGVERHSVKSIAPADSTTSTIADLITACEVIVGRWALTLTGDRIDQPRASMHRHVSVIKDIADFDDRRDVRALILLLTLRSAPGLRPGKSRFRVITDGELIALASKAKDG